MIYGTPEFEELLKDVISNGKRHDCYEECCEHAEEMSWHLYGVKPVKLLERTRPNEDPEIKDYRLENYEPITKSAADKAVHIVSKIFNPNLYSIRWRDKTPSSEELKKYTLEYYPSYNSIVNFLKDVLLRKMLADPNGVAVVTVDAVPYLESERLEPVLKVYGSKAIYYFDEDHYLISTKIEEEKFYYFDYYDKERTISFYAFIKQNGGNKDLVTVEEKNYQYDFTEIPVWKLRGMSESLDNGEIIFKSYFSSAVPYWNNAITHESDVFASYIRHMYPQRYELTEVCSYKMQYEGINYPCRTGHINHPKFGQIDCPHCSGTGYNPVGPYGVYQYTKEKLSESGPLGVDPVGYITVPTDATKMLEERAQRMIREGMWSINMDVEDEVGENQSGIAKVIDRSAQYDTLYNIGSVVFDVHLTNFYYFANKLMFGVEAVSSNLGRNVDKNLPEVNKPTKFDIGSVTELIHDLKAAKEAGVDGDIIQVKQIELTSRDLTTNPDLKHFTVLLLELDPLPGMSQTDIDRNVSRGYVRKVDAVIHFNKKAFVERAIRENPDFVKMEREDQIALLEQYAEELIKENKPVIDMTMISNVA